VNHEDSQKYLVALANGPNLQPKYTGWCRLPCPEMETAGTLLYCELTGGTM